MSDARTAPATISLYLIDDHALFREGLASVLEKSPGLAVAGMADSVDQAIREIPAAAPDLVLLDVDLGAERAIDFLFAARGAGLACRVLVVTAGISDVEAVALIREGVAGIFNKQASPDELCQAIRRVAAGDVHLEQRYLKGLFQNVEGGAGQPGKALSERELTVLRSVLRGLANKEIGERLGLSESTVKSVLRGLFDKLGVRTRSQLVKIALEEYSSLL
jgi:two-component system nitrate/nitrite response regulator NarL